MKFYLKHLKYHNSDINKLENTFLSDNFLDN